MRIVVQSRRPSLKAAEGSAQDHGLRGHAGRGRDRCAGDDFTDPEGLVERERRRRRYRQVPGRLGHILGLDPRAAGG